MGVKIPPVEGDPWSWFVALKLWDIVPLAPIKASAGSVQSSSVKSAHPLYSQQE